ncbi:MAG: glycosyltransferase, partial [Acidobacteriaceae bacterium]|nr:glycosyltransferase [Acidobacteriaceae bacterium]
MSKPFPAYKRSARCPRLLYLITRAERGGAQTHVLDLALSLQHDFEIEIATGEEGFLTEACRREGIAVHVLPHLRRDIKPFTDARALIEMHTLFRKIRPDLVHAHTFKAGLIGRFVARQCGIPAIYTAHMWPFGPGVPRNWRVFAPPVERLAAKWCHRLITVSHSGVELGRKYRIGAAPQIVAIHNGVHDCPERAVLNKAGAPTIAMVARFTHF